MMAPRTTPLPRRRLQYEEENDDTPVDTPPPPVLMRNATTSDLFASPPPRPSSRQKERPQSDSALHRRLDIGANMNLTPALELAALFGADYGPSFADYACSMHRIPGRLYITATDILFYSRLSFRRVVIGYYQVVSLQLVRTTSIRIDARRQTNGDNNEIDEHVFRSFRNREVVLQILKHYRQLDSCCRGRHGDDDGIGPVVTTQQQQGAGTQAATTDPPHRPETTTARTYVTAQPVLRQSPNALLESVEPSASLQQSERDASNPEYAVPPERSLLSRPGSTTASPPPLRSDDNLPLGGVVVPSLPPPCQAPTTRAQSAGTATSALRAPWAKARRASTPVNNRRRAVSDSITMPGSFASPRPIAETTASSPDIMFQRSMSETSLFPLHDDPFKGHESCSPLDHRQVDEHDDDDNPRMVSFSPPDPDLSSTTSSRDDLLDAHHFSADDDENIAYHRHKLIAQAWAQMKRHKLRRNLPQVGLTVRVFTTVNDAREARV
jgi:hypothetical protein